MAADEVHGDVAPLADERSRTLDGREQPRRDVDGVEQLGRPISGRQVEQPAAAGAGQLGGDLAGQVVGKQLRQHHDVPRPGQGGAVVGSELEDRVDRHQLQAGDLVEPTLSDPLDDVAVAGSALVAVRHRGLDELAAGIEQAVVGRPGVDADRCQRTAGTSTVETAFHLGDETVPVPPQRPAVVGDRAMGVAVDDLQLRLGLVEVDPAHADRRRPEVNGCDDCWHGASRYRPVASVVAPRSSTMARR